MKFLVSIVLLLLQSGSFTRFTYCHDNSRGPYELQCIEVTPDGKGQARLKRRGGEEIKSDVAMSVAARDRFLAALAATNNLEQGASYESDKKVADLGKKRLTLEMPAGNRTAEFNYSPRKDVIDLVDFFEGIINQEVMSADIDRALRFDRLSIPKWVEQIEKDLKSNRIADPERMIPLLDKIQTDQRLMNYSRVLAGKMKEQILAKKSK